ncbi:RICIN domain-containing protein [Kitasatospora sp. NPDC093558]|uniref:RICIN domain-containing protein n=1 Tax=Kitasatospora sp. NPDC093558 TaxID=3155201 RepID=UPI00342E8E30
MTMRFTRTLAGIGGLVLAATTAVAGAASPGYASAPTASRAEQQNTCTYTLPGANPTEATVTVDCSPAAAHAGVRADGSGSVHDSGPDRLATPPDSMCTGDGRGSGWYGIAPGSPTNGGVANDLWLDATHSAQNAQVQVWPGNGTNAQQWCFRYAGNGAFYVMADYALYTSCLDVADGDYNNYTGGLRVNAYNCAGNPGGGRAKNQLWYVCYRDQPNTFSLEPAFAANSSVWLDVWGGPGPQAFVPGNPLQVWWGNGADNQRFTVFTSPGSAPSSLSYTGGIPGC